MLTQENYNEYVKKFRYVEKCLRLRSASNEKVVYNICKMRGYSIDRMSDILSRAGFIYLEEPDEILYEELRHKRFKDLALFSDNGNFRVEGRFIFPVRDMLGNTIALIGWFPDEKKYITTPSKLFSKSCMFYGLEQLGAVGLGKPVFLCEGIFDVLSMRSIGLTAIGQMGITSSRVKEVSYSLFGRVVGVPDNDAEGRKVLSENKWNIPSNGSYLRWKSSKYKDIDAVVNAFEKDDISSVLKESLTTKSRLITLDLG